MQTRNRLIRRGIALMMTAVLTLLSCLPTLAATAYSDVPENAVWEPAVDRLTQIGVVQGTPSGAFLPDAVVTREQFAKMAVAAANLATSDNTAPGATRFADVSATRWSSGWIRTAVSEGMLVGYADGKFHPDATISYAQAMTVAIRLLGIDTATLTGTWPRNVLEKATSAGLTDGFSYDADDAMTRKDCAVLLARLLETDMVQTDNPGTVTFAEHTGLFRTVVVLADATVDRTLDAREVRTDIGTLTNVSGTAMAIGNELRLQLDGTRVIKVYGPASYSRTFPVEAVTEGTVYYRTGAGTVPLTPTADLDLYDNSGSLAYADLSARVPAGSQVTLAYDSDTGDLRYLQFSLPTESRTGSYVELLVLETAMTDSTLAGNRIVTDLGTLTLAAGLAAPSPGTRIGAVVNGTLVTNISGQVNTTVQATVLQAVGTQVVQTVNGVQSATELPSTATWYYQGNLVPFASVPGLVQRDSAIVYSLQPGGTEATTAVLYDPVYGAPQFADQQEIYDMMLGDIDLEDVLLSREGDLIKVYEIKYNDVAYEVTDIWGENRYVELYQGQAIGIIGAYLPNRFAPTSVQISVYSDDTGKFTSQTFQFSPDFPVSSLNNEDFGIGDTVIVLTGRDGKIVRMSQ